MTIVKLSNILAISSLAILACSFWCTPVNALSIDSHHVARHNARAHDAIAVKKRSNSTKRCKHRPSSSSSTTTTTAAPYTPAAAKAVAADPTTSSSSTTTTTPYAASTPSSGGGKIGIAWANGNDPALTHYKTPQTPYIYTWSPDKPDKSDSLGFTFMPMLWCDNQIGDFTRLVVEGYAHHVMGMNEPNENKPQCNIDASHGAYLWRTYIDPLKDKGYTTFSPATSSRPNGFTWMQDFFKACKGCRVDVLALHFYDLGVQQFKDHLTKYHDAFGLDIAVTEFAAHNFNNGTQYNAAEIKSFMTEVLQWGHETPWVHSLFPFGVMHDMQGVNPLDSLMKPDGTPTALGELVLNGGY